MEILKVLILNLSAQANARVNGCPMALTPLEKAQGEIFSYQFGYETSIADDKYTELKEAINRRISSALKMCGIMDIEIEYSKNAAVGFESV